MTAHPKIDKATLAAATHVQALVDEAVAAERLRIAALERQIRLHDAIMNACRSVAVATDELAQARFAGVREIPARRKVEAACKRLVTTMRTGEKRSATGRREANDLASRATNARSHSGGRG